MVNADQPYWLIGITEMTRTFGLELLESVLTNFSSVFFKVKFISERRSKNLRGARAPRDTGNDYEVYLCIMSTRNDVFIVNTLFLASGI